MWMEEERMRKKNPGRGNESLFRRDSAENTGGIPQVKQVWLGEAWEEGCTPPEVTVRRWTTAVSGELIEELANRSV